MIEIKNKSECTGCTACACICPKNAIQMVVDEEGFKYPIIDDKKCIGCNLCSKVCPMLKKYEKNENNIRCYAVYNKNEKVKKNSTSGGFFSALAEYVIKNKGIVYGAKFDENFNVFHYGTENINELSDFRGSKYVQSDIKNIFCEIGDKLEKNRLVLFSGTPCQVYGLKSYLQKDYSNLICVEVICHGTPSPIYYQEYLKDKIRHYKSEIKSISFREKTYGYGSSTMSIEFKNGKKYKRGHESDEMIKAFLRGYCSKESCYHCHFKSFGTIGDFKMGDLWNIDRYLGSDFKDGATLVISCSEKGEKLLKELNDRVVLKKIDKSKSEFFNGNGGTSMILNSAYRPQERDYFLTELNEFGYEKIRKKFLKIKPKEYMKMKLKPILYRMKLLDKIKLRSQ